jgi:8-amino-7-oxononanoate synthase
MKSIEQYLLAKLEQRKSEGNFRSLKVLPDFIDFTSNDYLGMARNPLFAEGVDHECAARKFDKVGATGSRLLTGNNAYVELVEQEIAAFHQSKTCLIFNSGFDANYGLLATVPGKDHLLIMDELVHASIHDGARASKAEKLFFKHNDLGELAQILSAENYTQKFVVVESVYSMNGDIADLKAISALCIKYNAQLIVDEAHATGVIGMQGEGVVQALGLSDQVFARVITFGKALGAHGACVLGSDSLKSFLINFCRPLIFSTGLSFHSLACIRVAYQLFPKMEMERAKLNENIAFFRTFCNHSSYAFLDSETAIQGLLIAGNEEVVACSAYLEAKGIDARPIRYPTVAKGAERIRICLHSYTTFEEIEQLFNACNNFYTTKSVHSDTH